MPSQCLAYGGYGYDHDGNMRATALPTKSNCNVSVKENFKTMKEVQEESRNARDFLLALQK